MRIPEYLSPSALAVYEKDIEEYYLRYLAEAHAPKPQQTQPMSVGSSFDAYIKDYLYGLLNGTTKGTDFAFEKLFEEQVEKHNRDFAREAGRICFVAYQTSGILPDLVAMLEDGSDHKFEVSLQNTITLDSETVTLLGKPDLLFISKCGRPIILDWKVNGYCSKSGMSPNKGYIICRDGWTDETHSRTHGQTHKDCFRSQICDGIWYNSAYPFEEFAQQWAAQMATYLWLCGEPVGSDALIIIHQLSWRNKQCRIADIRGIISAEYQSLLHERYVKVWNAIHTGMEGEMKLERMEQLSTMAKQSLEGMASGDATERAFIEMTRRA